MSMGPAFVRGNHLSDRKGKKPYLKKVLEVPCRTPLRETSRAGAVVGGFPEEDYVSQVPDG